MGMAKDLKIITSRIVPVLKDAGVSCSYVFGSYARGEATEESDLDIMVEFREQKSLLDLIDLKFKLEDVLRMRVDLTTPPAISKYIKKSVEIDKVRVL